MCGGALLGFLNLPKVPSFHPYAADMDLFFPTSLYHLPPALPGRFRLEEQPLHCPRPEEQGEQTRGPGQARVAPGARRGLQPPGAPLRPGPAGTAAAGRRRPGPRRRPLPRLRREGFPAGAVARFPPLLAPAPRRPPGRAGRHLAPRHVAAAPPGRTPPRGGLAVPRQVPPRPSGPPSLPPSLGSLSAGRPAARPRSPPPAGDRPPGVGGAGGPGPAPGEVSRQWKGGGSPRGGPGRGQAERGNTYSRFSCGCSCRCMAREKPKRLPGSPRRLITSSVSRLKAPACPSRRGR